LSDVRKRFAKFFELRFCFTEVFMSRRLLAAFVAALFVLAMCAPVHASQAAPQKQPPAKKARKVWTNEDLEALRPSGVTVSAPRAAAPSAAGEATAADNPADKAGAEKKDDDKNKEEDPVEKLLKRLAPLRLELASVEARLASLRSARSSGNTTGGGMDVSKTSGGMNTEDQVLQLEKRRSDLLGQIAAIGDEARRKGISPGAIR
jgi:hypothetical protein